MSPRAASIGVLSALGAVGALGGALVLGSCSPNLDVGEVGKLRYAGRVKGEVPLNILPPVADMSGNVYVLNGAPLLAETHAFVGFAGGGWSGTCSLTKGDVYGAHGWAGFAQSRQWYWSGGALVSVSGADGTCHAVLDKDPATGAELFFQAVLPAVRNLSERATLVALVQTPTDPTPFSVVVDLDAEFMTNVSAFEPADAENVAVIGVGGDRTRELGLVLVQYQQGGKPHLELRSYDNQATFFEQTRIDGGPFAPYAVQGYLQIDDAGLVAGLLAAAEGEGTFSLLTAEGGSGSITPITNMTPAGVHLWNGELWLVGVSDDKPVIAPIGRGRIGSPSRWDASLAVAGSFGGATTVRDDRSLPSRTTTWNDVRTATGAFPFLSAHALTKHADGTTLWTFAGPVVRGAGLPQTAFATAPVGVSYP